MHTAVHVRLNRPVAIRIFRILIIAEARMRIEMLNAIGRPQTSAAHCRMSGHEASALNAVVRLEHHEQLVGRRRNRMRQLGAAKPTQSEAVR